MASDQVRDTSWRQGLVLEFGAAVDLKLVKPDSADQHLAVVVTHDCDIASDCEREPNVEIIVGKRITALGADTNAKTARRLHVAFETENGYVPIELEAFRKEARSKSAVLSTPPRPHWRLPPEQLVTLQKWLAARYHRSAFADEFERRLKDKPARLDRQIAQALKKASEHVLAIFFEVDGGSENQRSGANDLYQLNITLLYDSTKDEPTASEAAREAAESIEAAFETAFRTKDGKWQNIQLLACQAVSDNAMTIAQSRLLKPWRLDHVSLESDPQQDML